MVRVNNLIIRKWTRMKCEILRRFRIHKTFFEKFEKVIANLRDSVYNKN